MVDLRMCHISLSLNDNLIVFILIISSDDVMMKWPWRDQFKPVVPALEKCIRENLSNTASLVNIEEKNEPNKMIFVHGMYFV